MGEFAAMAAIGAANAALGAAQAGQRAEAENRAQTDAVSQQLQQRALAAKIEERRRQEQLARDKATALARFGGQGIASAGGSPDAVLGGLTAASARRGAEAASQQSLAMSGSLLDLADRNRLNLLRAAEARQRALLGIAETGANLWSKSKRTIPDLGGAGGSGGKL
jgi:hypothetical protein